MGDRNGRILSRRSIHPVVGHEHGRHPAAFSRVGNELCRHSCAMGDIKQQVDHLARLDARIQSTEITVEKLRSMVDQRLARGANTVEAMQALTAVEASLGRYRTLRAALAQLIADLDAGRR